MVFYTRFERNPIHSPSGTILASEIDFLLRAEPRMQDRKTRLLWNLHSQGTEGRNLYNHNKIVQIPRQECTNRICFHSLIFIFECDQVLFGFGVFFCWLFFFLFFGVFCGFFFFWGGESTFKDKVEFWMIRISRSQHQNSDTSSSGHIGLLPCATYSVWNGDN